MNTTRTADKNNIETLKVGNYLGLYKKDGWEWAQRPNASACVGILPILSPPDLSPTTQILLVEQYRIPCQKYVIEIPAGLVGDEEAFQDESLSECAARELLEETGYKAGQIHPLITSPTSAGMTPEITHLYAATQLEKVSEGGGIGNEKITVHSIALDELTAWLSTQEHLEKLIDSKIHASLWLAQQKGLLTAP